MGWSCMPTDYSVKVIAALYGVSQWENVQILGTFFFFNVIN